MPHEYKVACVFGGTGFLGTQVVRALAKAGYTVKLATRVPEKANEQKTCGTVGQVVPLACNYTEEDIRNAVKGSSCVVNLIGVLYEKGKSTFSRAHTDIPRMIAKACTSEGVQRFVHVSALGIDESQSKYAQSKLSGEKAVIEEFPNATILRPSVVFGADDDFFNMFAGMARFLPALPLIGGGNTLFQPVYVGDVADAVLACLTLPDKGEKSPLGNVYSLGGPEVLSFKEIYARLFKETGRKRSLIPLPYGIAKIQGLVFSASSKIIGGITGLTPKPLLTADQVESLKTNTIVPEGVLGLSDLGIRPTAMDIILPTYLGRYRPGGRFGDKKSA